MMEHKIINTGDYLLIVDDSEIKKETYCYDSINNILVFYKGSMKNIGFQKVISHLPLNNSPILEGVDLLPSLEDEVEKLACEHLGWSYSLYKERKDDYELSIIKSPPFNTRDINIYSNGYNKAKEKYKYTEENLRSLTNSVTEFLSHHEPSEFNVWFEKKLQSLQQPKTPVGFKCEVQILRERPTNIRNHVYDKTYEVPKTTTNSQGLTQWVGEYIY
jgi:hypothetical protein